MPPRFLAAALCLVALGCRRAPPPQEIRVALSSAPLTLDPHASNESAAFAVDANLFQTLVRLDDRLAITPALALRWFNPDDLTWVFDLDANARFHDGTPLTAADVVYSLARAKDDPVSEWRGALISMTSAEAALPSRVVVHTARPSPTLLRCLAGIAVIPRAYATQHPDLLATRPVGSGPYRFLSREGALVRLTRNATRPPPAIAAVLFEGIPDGATRVRELLERRADLIADVPPSSVAMLRGTAGIRVLEAAGLRQMFLGFDVARAHTPYASPEANPFRDVRVRRACRLAIDTRRLVDTVLAGHGEPNAQLVASRVLGYDPRMAPLRADPAAALRLLADAGYPDGFEVTLDAPAGVYVADTATAAFVRDALAAIKIRVRLRLADKAALFDRLTRHDTTLFLASWNCLTADAQEVFDYLLHTQDPAKGYGIANAGSYSNPAVDALSEEAAVTMSPARRLAALQKALAVALDDVPWVPLHAPSTLYAIRDPFVWTPRSDKRIAVEDVGFDPAITGPR